MYTNVPLPAQVFQTIRERSESKKSDKPSPKRSEELNGINSSVGEGTGTGCQTDAQQVLGATSSETMADVDYNPLNPLVKVDDGSLTVNRKNVSGGLSVEVT